MSFDQYYFAAESLGNGYSRVKFGDSRSISINSSNYRGGMEKGTLHGNSNRNSPGKFLEENLLHRLVDFGMAKRIGQSETYIVANSTAASLRRIAYPNGGIVTHDQLYAMANAKIYFKENRRVHGNRVANKF